MPNKPPGTSSHVYNVTTDDGVIVGVVAGLRCSFLIDSGAQVNTFTEDLFQELISNPKHRDEVFEVKYQTDRPLKAYATVGEIKVVATFLAYLFISDDRPLLLEKFYVVSEVRALLGRSTASRYSILMLGLKVPVQSQRFGSHISLIAGEIATIATNEIFPKFNLPPVKIHYDRSKPPCRNIFLNIPLAVRPLVEKRIQELINANIIEPVVEGMDTSFCSSMLVVPKGKNDIRLVIDLRGPNRYIFRTPFSMPTLEQILAELDGATWFSTIDIANAFFHIELDEESRHLTNFFTEFGRRRALDSAHGGHVGVMAMKRVMRQFFWWPKMSAEVSRFVKNCETCALLSKRNPPVPLVSRELPDGPWEVLQVDFLSVPNFGSGEFLIVIDTYSRYLHVVEMRSMDAESTNSALSEVFQTWGLPIVIQSDNGPRLRLRIRHSRLAFH